MMQVAHIQLIANPPKRMYCNTRVFDYPLSSCDMRYKLKHMLLTTEARDNPVYTAKRVRIKEDIRREIVFALHPVYSRIMHYISLLSGDQAIESDLY